MTVEEREDVVTAFEAHPHETFAALENGGLTAAVEHDLRPFPRYVARADLRERLIRTQHALDQELDPPAARLAPGEPRLDDARVVQHDEVFGRDEAGDSGEREVPQSAARAVEMEKPARGAVACRHLRDQLGR